MKSETQVIEAPIGIGMDRWPIEVRALVASLQTPKQYIARNKRREPRHKYEIQTTVWFKDAAAKVLSETAYTRDISTRMVAFVCPRFLRVGQSVILEMPDAAGAMQQIQGHIRRCRQFSEGWCDCVMEFSKGAKAGR